jgi:NADPH:quinone reductase-like Zn-dependent oxidoreductase
MKAYEIREFGIENLACVERAKPRPGCGEVLVRVRAVSLNYRDLLVVRGQYNPKLRRPMVPCSDASGEVAAVGDGVTRARVGDRVAGTFFEDWLDGEISEEKTRSARGGGIQGVLAEYVLLKEHGLVQVPEHLTDEEAAALPCAAVTAWNALMEQGELRPGQTVLVQGTGGVSLFALQFASAAGARVIATSSSDEKLERARALGASEGINYRTRPGWDEAVRELTGSGVDHIVEVGGAGTLPRSLRAVRMGGVVSLIGVLTGNSAEFNPVPVLMKSVRLQGIYVGSRAMFERMNRAISVGQLRPLIDRVFPFDEAADAFRHLESGAHFGKVCIRLS